jgi:hypothetical protein
MSAQEPLMQFTTPLMSLHKTLLASMWDTNSCIHFLQPIVGIFDKCLDFIFLNGNFLKKQKFCNKKYFPKNGTILPTKKS